MIAPARTNTAAAPTATLRPVLLLAVRSSVPLARAAGDILGDLWRFAIRAKGSTAPLARAAGDLLLGAGMAKLKDPRTNPF